ncbi:hypothetical protein C8R42DRAFT_724664 [Lentinula raphanica]|nr:hypothetical protein C8R42DRAFT_724664 [Lentinula raphanica]
MSSGALANVTISANIASGDYLIRHELIALQIAQAEGGAELYLACVQVSIEGDEMGTPTGAASWGDTDPGISSLLDVCSTAVDASVARPRSTLEPQEFRESLLKEADEDFAARKPLDEKALSGKELYAPELLPDLQTYRASLVIGTQELPGEEYRRP